MFKEEKIDLHEIKKTLKERNLVFSEEGIYIMPEGSSEDSDLLNEHAPDIYKFLKQNDIDSILVKKENYSFLALRDSTEILAYIIGIPFCVLANFLYDWIKNNFNDKSIIEFKFTKKKKNGEMYKIKFKGTSKELQKVLEQLGEI